jgi:hypothetical protein
MQMGYSAQGYAKGQMSKRDDAVDKALNELLEAQNQINEVARGIVERYKKLLDSPERLESGASAAFAREHGKWYDGIEKEMVALGFRALGAYENANARDTPEERRSFYRFALSSDGTIVANWFLFPGKTPRLCVVLESTAEDGAKWITASGVTDTGMPMPPNRKARVFPASASLKGLVTTHRREIEAAKTPLIKHTGMTSILAARLSDSIALSEYREGIGIGLFKGIIRNNYKTDEEFEENGRQVLDAIEAHPQWWTGEEPKQETPPAVDPGAPLRVLFMMSRDEQTGRGHITTTGLAARGLPELQMKELAANHCRAARFLMAITARKLVEHVATLPASETPIGERLSGTRLSIDGREAASRLNTSVLGKFPETPDLGPVEVELTLEESGGKQGQVADIFAVLLGGRRPGKLLRVTGPGADQPDEWLRDATRRLGMDTPTALPADAFTETMTAASQRAVAGLEGFRARIRSGLPAGQFAVVKTGLATTSESREFVWVRVTDTPDGEFVGTLAVQPSDAPGYTRGQAMRIADKDVYDRAIFDESTGVVEPALTDVVAQEFGVDLPG